MDGIGDALACTPLIAALREAGHRVSAVLTTRNAGVFAADALENVHVMERIPWPRHGYTPQTWDRALADAAAQDYDVALIPSEEPQAYTFAREAKIPQRAGFYNGWQKPFKSLWARAQLTRAVARSARQPRAPRHEVETLFALGAGLCTRPEPPRDAALLRPLILEEAVEPGTRPAVQITRKWLNAGRTAPDVRRWFAAMACDPARKWSALCAESERLLGEELGERAGLNVTYFATLASWKAAIARAAWLVTPDTGAAHVAGMTGVPCTDIFEARNAQSHIAQWRPWASRSQLLQFPKRAGDAAAFVSALLNVPS